MHQDGLFGFIFDAISIYGTHLGAIIGYIQLAAATSLRNTRHPAHVRYLICVACILGRICY
jgi:hypothetical protein